MAERSTNTMVEWLQRVGKDIFQMKMQPDADLEFLTGIETMLLEYARKPIAGMEAQGQLPQGPAQQAPAMPAPMNGLIPGGPQINPDELRRVAGLAQQ